MRPVLDASALVALLRAEPAASEVEALFADGPVHCSAINLSEVAFHLVRRGHQDADAVERTLAGLGDAGLAVVPVGAGLSVRAGILRAAHYHRSRAPVSFADCVAVATAEAVAGPLVTSDAALCRLALDLGVVPHPIPNSKGVRPRVNR